MQKDVSSSRLLRNDVVSGVYGNKVLLKKGFLHGPFPVLLVFHFFLSAFNLYRLLLFDANCFTTNLISVSCSIWKHLN